MIHGISHVVVYTTNMKESIDFFVTKLSCTLLHQSDGFTTINVGGETQIGLHTTKELKLPRIHTEVSFKVKDINKTYDKLKKNGVEFFRDVIEIAPGSYVANFRDNMGNNFSIYEMKDTK